jgi:hypothetical protein
MAIMTLSRQRAPTRSTQGQPVAQRSERRTARELLLAQAKHARAAMGPDYGTNITGMSSEDFKARMRRMIGRG